MMTLIEPTNGVDTPEVAPEVMRQIIAQEIQLWKNTRYQIEVRLRVERRIKGPPDAEADLIKQLEQIERRLDAYQEELRAL